MRRRHLETRPLWRSRDIEDQVSCGRWLRSNLADRVDTGRGGPTDTATAVASWVASRLDQTAYPG